MSAPAPHRAARMDLDGYVDQVVRKQQFLADNPDVAISANPEVPPWEYWQGQVAGSEAATSSELGHLLNKLTDQVAIRDAQADWPNWTFTRHDLRFAGLADQRPRVARCPHG